ncbi:unnamed protein product [Rhodiola kirilowii]
MLVGLQAAHTSIFEASLVFIKTWSKCNCGQTAAIIGCFLSLK